MAKKHKELTTFAALKVFTILIRFRGNSTQEQIAKIKEELLEVEEELLKNKYSETTTKENIDKLIEECFDLRQAVETLIFKLITEIYTDTELEKNIEKAMDTVQKYYAKHELKMLNKFNMLEEVEEQQKEKCRELN
jgi:hypothetical protein